MGTTYDGGEMPKAKYTVELNNSKGTVPVTGMPLSGKDARALADEMRKQLPTGSTASYSVREAKS